MDKKSFNTTGNYSVFTSKVPIARDAKPPRDSNLPGPTAYDPKTVKYGDSCLIGSQMGASTEDSSTMTQNANPFLSGTGRGDMWKNEIVAPFTKSTSTKNPGPGTYFHGKKKEEIKQRLL